MVGSGKNEQVCHLKGGECLPQPILAMRYRKPRTTRILVFKDTGTLHFYWLSLYPQILTTNSNLNTVSDEQKNVVRGLPIGDPLLSVIPRLSFWKPRGQVLSVSAQVPVIARKQEHGSDNLNNTHAWQRSAPGDQDARSRVGLGTKLVAKTLHE